MRQSKMIATRWALMAALTVAIFQQAGAAVKWSDSLATATAAAKKRGCLMMVVLYKSGAKMSTKLMSESFADADVVTTCSAFESFRADAATNGADLANAVHVTHFPTIFFIDPTAHKFTEIDGYLPPGRLAATLQSFAEAWSFYPATAAKLKLNPNDGVAAAKMVVIDAMRFDPSDATLLIPTVKANAPDLLSASYNAIGDAYNADNQDDAAKPWYKLTLDIGKPQSEVINAHLGLYEIADDSNDKATMKAELNAILALPNLPTDVKTDAQAKLAAVDAAK